MRPQPKQAVEDLGRIDALYERVLSEARKLATAAAPSAGQERSHCRLSDPATGSERPVRYPPLNRPSDRAAFPQTSSRQRIASVPKSSSHS